MCECTAVSPLRSMRPYLQRLEDGPPVGSQLGVRGRVEELGEGRDGVQFISRDLERREGDAERE